MKSARERLLTSTIIGGALALSLTAVPAFAQQQDPTPVAGDQRSTADESQTQPDDPTEANDVDEVVVTGSRLRQRDLTANSPVETVTAAELQNAGTATVETFLNQLPQVVPSISQAANNPSQNGAAQLDLRGLGTERNLVLLDGRRLVGSDSDNVVDVNIIPTALIDRVELLTGGASSTYGPDAVAGVVNFILKNDFEGVEFDASYQMSERGDAGLSQGSLTIGGNFNEGRGNAVVNFSYANREGVGKGAREFTSQAGNLTSFFPSGAYRTAGNSPTQAAVNAVFGQYGVAPGAVPQGGGASGFGFNGDNTLFATGGGGANGVVQNFRRDESEIATNFFPNRFSFNFEPQNLLVLPLERQTFSTFANYDITDRINVYGQAVFANYNANSALAASPAPTGVNPTILGADGQPAGVSDFSIPVTNPFIPADLATLLASRTGNNPALPGTGATEDFTYRFRTSALGPRGSANDVNVYNVLIGAKLELPGDWEGDVYGSQGRYNLTEVQTGNLSVRRFEQLLDSPTGGTEFCNGGFNPFGVGLNADCAAFVAVTAKNETTIEQDNVVAVFNGPIPFSLPAGQVQVALGTEYRSVDFNFLPDSALQPGEVAGFNGQQPIRGSIDFYELFGEAAIPLVSNAPLIRSLDLTLGYRFTDSNQSNTASTYKAELSYSPIEAIRIRGSYQHAIRSPSIGELFAPPDEDNPEVADPCNADNPERTAQVIQLCEAQAVALGFTPQQAEDLIATYQQGNDQIQALVGGNPDLDPEEADTITLGVVFRPDLGMQFFNNFNVSLDYYNIKIEKAIFEADPQLVANNCYNIGATTNPNFDPNNAACQQFSRSPADFAILNLLQLQANQGALETSGVDFALGFQTPLADITGIRFLGEITTSVLITHVSEFIEQESPIRDPLDFAGSIGDDYGETLPEWKANVNFGYALGDFSADIRGRYIDSMEHRSDILAGGDDEDATGVGSAWYWDLATRYAVNDTAEVRFGVLNLFDREVEEYDPFIDAQTDPSTYDVIGRRYYVGLNLRF